MIQPGTKFGLLTVVRYEYTKNNYNRMYLCQCDCGRTKLVQESALKTKNTISCGCFRKAQSKKMGLSNRKHFGCMLCGSTDHYAKGLCSKCYQKASRNKWEFDWQ